MVHKCSTSLYYKNSNKGDPSADDCLIKRGVVDPEGEATVPGLDDPFDRLIAMVHSWGKVLVI